METSATNVEKDKERASDIASSAASTEVTGMRRDHESIDDFEHLEPESSPLSEIPSKHSFDINPDVKSTVSSGSTTIVGKAENNQNSSDFSLLGDSKVGSVEAGNTPETLEEIPPAEFSNKLIDFESHDQDTKLDSKLNVEPEKSLFASIESNKQTPENLFDLPTQKGSGLDLFNRFEISPKGSDASAMSHAFMEMERGGMREGKNVRNEDVLQPEVQKNTEPKTDELPKQKIEEKKPAEPEFHPAFAHLKDEAHDDDSFKDTDSIPEQIKAEEKFKDFPEEIHPASKDFGFPEPNVHGDFHPPAPATKGSEGSSAIDRLEDKKVKDDTKSRTDDTVTKHDLELGIPTQITGKQKQEEKSPIKTKPEVVKPTIKAEAKKTAPKVDDEPVIAPFALASIGLDAWFKPDRLHPKVVELVYWRDPKKSGIVFGSVLGILLSLTYFSLISVIAYLSLAILTGTISFRVYKTVLQAVQKTTSDGHPFKDILELDLNLPQEKVREMTDLGVAHLNAAACELRRLFLVEDLVDSIKFGVLLWCLTYVGAWFNGMTLIIIAFVALFTLPKVYETNKVQIDQNIDLVRSKIAEISSKIKATIRVGGKKPEEKKE